MAHCIPSRGSEANVFQRCHIDRAGGVISKQWILKRYNVRLAGIKRLAQRVHEPFVWRIIRPEREHAAGVQAGGKSAQTIC